MSPPRNRISLAKMQGANLSEKDPPIRSVVRALNLLRTLNTREFWSLHQLYLATSLPKATLSRLLATLIGEGYVRAEEPAGTYRLAARIRELDAGYTENIRLVDCSIQILLRVTQQIKWPLALAVPEIDAMVVRFSTMPYSPLAVYTTTLGHRYGFLDSAIGRVYLAFCSPAERDAVLDHIKAADWATTEITRVYADGYAVRQPGINRGSATLAVPMLRTGQAIAALAMTTYGRSMTKTAIDRHLPILNRVAQECVAAFNCGPA